MNAKIPAIKHAIFSTVMAVRINDINYGNHLGHDALVSFFHEARLRFLKSLGYSELNIEGFGILITHLSVNYLREAFYADQIVLELGIEEIGKTRVQLNYQARNQDSNQVIANALTTMTFFDYTQSKVVRVPAAFLAILKQR